MEEDEEEDLLQDDGEEAAQQQGQGVFDDYASPALPSAGREFGTGAQPKCSCMAACINCTVLELAAVAGPGADPSACLPACACRLPHGSAVGRRCHVHPRRPQAGAHPCDRPRCLPAALCPRHATQQRAQHAQPAGAAVPAVSPARDTWHPRHAPPGAHAWQPAPRTCHLP
jgi:hypothetical protein